MIIQQFFTKWLAHSSYLLGGSKTCAIVDPTRDIKSYIETARSMGLKITHILETHLHADFVSGHVDLAEETGGKIFAPRSGNCNFNHTPVSEGDNFMIEDMEITVMDIPGHTPEGVGYTVVDNSRGEKPVCIFCGDTLFVGDVGRPDLFPGRANELAADLYSSLHNKIMDLPDFCEVYPAHGAGSLCGRSMGAKRSSTVGYEKLFNPELQILDEEEFIKSLTTHMPSAPDHFSRCSEINRKGPKPLKELPIPKPIKPRDFKKITDNKNTIVLDVRTVESFGGQHIPGAYHVDFSGNFITFAGWIIPPDNDILLVVDSAEEVNKVVTWLRRVGLDDTIGYLEGGMYAWAKEGLPMDHVRQLSSPEFKNLMDEKEFTLLDVRTRREYALQNIKGSVNIPSPELRTRHAEIDSNKEVVVICNSGHRSSTATSLLKQNGFKNVYNVAGGMMGYNAAGYIAECPMCSAPHGPRLTQKV
ncbi:rhodanese-like domain-containing protein [Candidatus Altiarchaeota archaeon]